MGIKKTVVDLTKPVGHPHRVVRYLETFAEEQDRLAAQGSAQAVGGPAREALKQAVKADAQARILAVMPEWKQRNALAHALVIERKRRLQQDLSEAELEAETAYLAFWDEVSTLRTNSDIAEQDIDKAESFEEAKKVRMWGPWEPKPYTIKEAS